MKRTHYQLGLGLLALGVALALSVEVAEAMGEAVEHTTDRALESLFGLGLPLAAGLTFFGRRYEADARGPDGSSLLLAARYGRDRRREVLPRFALTALPLSLAFVGAALFTVSLCRDAGDPHLSSDLTVTGNVALVASLTTSALLFAARALFGRLGVVAWSLVGIVFWKPRGILGHVLPGGHVRHLLGLGATRSYEEWMSFVVLGGVIVLAVLLSSRLVRR